LIGVAAVEVVVATADAPDNKEVPDKINGIIINNVKTTGVNISLFNRCNCIICYLCFDSPGFLVMDNMKDTQESIALTFWETKEDMDAFYHPNNKTLANLVETAKPLFEQMPERNDYQISSFKI
jgi:hypothetical protein